MTLADGWHMSSHAVAIGQTDRQGLAGGDRRQRLAHGLECDDQGQGASVRSRLLRLCLGSAFALAFRARQHR